MKDSFHYLDEPRKGSPKRESEHSVATVRPHILDGPRHVDVPLPYVVETDESGKLIDYFRICWRNNWIVGLIAFSGFVFALLVSLPQQPMYRAQAAVEIQDANENFLNKGFDSSSSGNGDTAETSFQTQIRLLRTESLLERVADKLHMHGRPGKNDSKPSFLRSILPLPKAAVMPERERLLQQIAQNLTVRVSGQTRVVEILYESPDPALAANFANTLVNEFIEQSQEVRWRSTQRTGEWLTRQLAAMKIKLEQSEAQLQAMAKASGLMPDSGKGSIEDAKLRQLEDELSKAQAARLDRQSKLELASQSSAESLPEILDDPTIRDYTLKLTDLRRQFAELELKPYAGALPGEGNTRCDFGDGNGARESANQHAVTYSQRVRVSAAS